MKAKDVPSFTSFTGFAFTGNSLICRHLSLLVKAVKAKNTTYRVVTRAYARGSKAIGAGKIYLRAKFNYL